MQRWERRAHTIATGKALCEDPAQPTLHTASHSRWQVNSRRQVMAPFQICLSLPYDFPGCLQLRHIPLATLLTQLISIAQYIRSPAYLSNTYYIVHVSPLTLGPRSGTSFLPAQNIFSSSNDFWKLLASLFLQFWTGHMFQKLIRKLLQIFFGRKGT